MGWLCFDRKGREIKNILRASWRPYEVLDIAIVNMTVAYIAVDIGDGEVVAGVTLLRHKPEFCYKSMDESMGLYEQDCPERILKLLTGSPTGHAKAWREICWKNIETRKRIKAGEYFELAQPIKFSDGVRRSEFYRMPGRKERYRCTVDGVICKISRDCLRNVIFDKDKIDGQDGKENRHHTVV